MCQWSQCNIRLSQVCVKLIGIHGFQGLKAWYNDLFNNIIIIHDVFYAIKCLEFPIPKSDLDHNLTSYPYFLLFLVFRMNQYHDEEKLEHKKKRMRRVIAITGIVCIAGLAGLVVYYSSLKTKRTQRASYGARGGCGCSQGDAI